MCPSPTLAISRHAHSTGLRLALGGGPIELLVLAALMVTSAAPPARADVTLQFDAEDARGRRQTVEVFASPHGVYVSSGARRAGKRFVHQRTPRRFWLIDVAAGVYAELNQQVYHRIKERLLASRRVLETSLERLPEAEQARARRGVVEPAPGLGGGIVTSLTTQYEPAGPATRVGKVRCEPFEGRRDGVLVVELCVATDGLGLDLGTSTTLAALAPFADDARIVEQLWMPWFGLGKRGERFASDGGPRGLPVKQVLYDHHGKVTSTLTLTRISAETVDASLMQLPGGLRRQ